MIVERVPNVAFHQSLPWRNANTDDTFGWCPMSCDFREYGPVYFCRIDAWRKICESAVDFYHLRQNLYLRMRGDIKYPECYGEFLK